MLTDPEGIGEPKVVVGKVQLLVRPRGKPEIISGAKMMI
jgi:hypothetical protein